MLLTALVSIVTFARVLLVPVFMQGIQGESAIVAGLTLLPQGLIIGIGTVLGNQLPAKWGMRRTVVVGISLLTRSTIGLLAVNVTSSPWLIAGILSGRGFAVGLVIQPLLNTLIESLPPDKVPDGNTLFNVVERVSGTVGIALIMTLFQVRESFHVRQWLQQVGLSSSLAGSGAKTGFLCLPTAWQEALAKAAAAGFHDVIWLIAGLSALGIFLALVIKNEVASTEETC